MSGNRTTEFVDEPDTIRNEFMDDGLLMTDNRTTELLCKLLDERGVEYFTDDDERAYDEPARTTWDFVLCGLEMTVTATEFVDIEGKTYLEMDFHHAFTPEQAIAATLGRPKAKSHPYGYERDTGAYDCTRCECGCINDISATYCNDCGGKIEIDESAEKEYYDGYSKHMVFAKKHDDGSLELCERRYVPEDAATLGSERHPYEQRITGDGSDWGEIMRDAYDDLMASACESCTPEQMEQLADYIRAELGSGTCEWLLEHSGTLYDKWRCSKCGYLHVESRTDGGATDFEPNYCPNCGKKVER